MKWLTFVFCLIFGHNKILETQKENQILVHHTTCTQCEKKWFAKKLNVTSKIKFKKYTIKIRAQGKKISVEKMQEEMLLTKQKVNFYAL